MFGYLVTFFLASPDRLKALGKSLCGISSTLIVIGLALRIPVVYVEHVQTLGVIHWGDVTLASMYPTLPTWCIPESALTYVFLVAAFGFGVYVQEFAKSFERTYFR